MEKNCLREARMELIRSGYPLSNQNKKLRRRAFEMLVAITEAFFPNPKDCRPGCFGGMGLGLVLETSDCDVALGSEIARGPCNFLAVNGAPAIAFTQDGIIPSDGMVAVNEALWFATCSAAQSFIPLLRQLEDARGIAVAEEIANALGIKFSH